MALCNPLHHNTFRFISQKKRRIPKKTQEITCCQGCVKTPVLRKVEVDSHYHQEFHLHLKIHSWTNVRFENTVVTFLHQNLHGHKSTFKWPAHLLQAPRRSSLELRVLALQRASCLTELASGINSHFQKRFARWESESEYWWKVKVTKSELLLKSSGGRPGEAAQEEEDRQQWWSPVGWQVFYFAFSWQLILLFWWAFVLFVSWFRW